MEKLKAKLKALVAMLKEPDKKLHLKLGLAFAVGVLATIVIANKTLIGLALIIASIVMGKALERYQAIRHEGSPDNKDWLASSLPGVLLGVVLCVLRI